MKTSQQILKGGFIMAEEVKKVERIVNPLSRKKKLQMTDLTKDNMIAYVNSVARKIEKEQGEDAATAERKWFAEEAVKATNAKNRVEIKPLREAFLAHYPNIKEKIPVHVKGKKTEAQKIALALGLSIN